MKTFSEVLDLLNTKGWWNYDPHSLSGYVEYVRISTVIEVHILINLVKQTF